MRHQLAKGITVLALGLALLGCHRSVPYEPEVVTVDHVQERLAKGEQLLFVDVRSARSYEREHIEGAINVPASKLGEKTVDLPQNRWMVLYCT